MRIVDLSPWLLYNDHNSFNLGQQGIDASYGQSLKLDCERIRSYCLMTIRCLIIFDSVIPWHIPIPMLPYACTAVGVATLVLFSG
jgi:hypothetical protein